MIDCTQKLIELSYKESGLYRSDKILTGSQVQEALEILNLNLDYLSSRQEIVGYYDLLTFQLVTTKREYVISPSGGDVVGNKIVELKFVVIYEADNYRYPVKIESDTVYYNNVITPNLRGRPYQCFIQNGIKKSTLVFFSYPDVQYTCEIKGKFALSNLELDSDLSTIPAYYIEYLRLYLAKKLCMTNLPKLWTVPQENELVKIEKNIINMSDVDMRLLVNVPYYGYNRLGVTFT